MHNSITVRQKILLPHLMINMKKGHQYGNIIWKKEFPYQKRIRTLIERSSHRKVYNRKIFNTSLSSCARSGVVSMTIEYTPPLFTSVTIVAWFRYSVPKCIGFAYITKVVHRISLHRSFMQPVAEMWIAASNEVNNCTEIPMAVISRATKSYLVFS